MTFTVVDRTTLFVLLTNNATKTAGGSSAPPAPPAPPVSPGPGPKTPDPTELADPGASDPVNPSESAKAPKAVPTPIKPGLPRTGHEG